MPREESSIGLDGLDGLDGPDDWDGHEPRSAPRTDETADECGGGYDVHRNRNRTDSDGFENNHGALITKVVDDEDNPASGCCKGLGHHSFSLITWLTSSDDLYQDEKAWGGVEGKGPG